MEVLNETWKEILVWNGRFLEWNGRKLPVRNMEKSSFIPYHALVAVKQFYFVYLFVCITMFRVG